MDSGPVSVQELVLKDFISPSVEVLKIYWSQRSSSLGRLKTSSELFLA